MTIDDLKQEALNTCRWRGHVMSPFDEFLVSECVVCGLTAYLDEYPGPNGIKLGGSALAVDCDHYWEGG
jgi:hypothetical protein